MLHYNIIKQIIITVLIIVIIAIIITDYKYKHNCLVKNRQNIHHDIRMHTLHSMYNDITNI